MVRSPTLARTRAACSGLRPPGRRPASPRVLRCSAFSLHPSPRIMTRTTAHRVPILAIAPSLTTTRGAYYSPRRGASAADDPRLVSRMNANPIAARRPSWYLPAVDFRDDSLPPPPAPAPGKLRYPRVVLKL